MLKKYIFLFLIFLIMSISIVSAQIIVVNDTTIPTFNPTPIPTKIATTITTIPPVMEKLSQTFYGEVRYADGNPVSPGSIIVAKDQYGKNIGNYIVRELGEYGSSKPYGEKMIVSVLKNQSDRTSRSSVIFVNFFVDGIRSRDSVEFKVGEDDEFNILLPIVKPTPIPTIIPTTIITPVPTIARPVNTSTITPIQVTALPIIPQSTTSTIIPGIEDMQLIIYGFIGMIIIIVGIIIIVIIQSYLMNKSSREGSLGPDGKWDRK